MQLNSLVTKFKKDVELFEQYNNVIEEYKEKKFIEEVDPTDYSGCFLPHHPVYRESATTPLRIVYNASSYPKGGGKSLNDCLYAGPSLTTKLHDLLDQDLSTEKVISLSTQNLPASRMTSLRGSEEGFSQ